MENINKILCEGLNAKLPFPENNSIIFKLKILFMTSYINKRIIFIKKTPGKMPWTRGPVAWTQFMVHGGPDPIWTIEIKSYG